MSSGNSVNHGYIMPIPQAYHINGSNLKVLEMCRPPAYSFPKKTYKMTRDDLQCLIGYSVRVLIVFLFSAVEVSIFSFIVYRVWDI